MAWVSNNKKWQKNNTQNEMYIFYGRQTYLDYEDGPLNTGLDNKPIGIAKCLIILAREEGGRRVLPS